MRRMAFRKRLFKTVYSEVCKMKKYCEQCRELHDENDMCPKYKELLKKHPEWLEEAVNFTTVAAEYSLITTQTLNEVAKTVNRVVGTNLSYEGTHQTVRDIQVFAKLNSDSFSKSGQFANAQAAKETLENASDGFKRYLKGRLNGTGQEIDWLRWRQGKFDSLINKYSLPDGNTVGYDGVKINRFTGKTIERVTIKSAQGNSGLQTNAKDVVEAIEKGTLNPNDKVYGVEGMNRTLQKTFEKSIAEAEKQGNVELVNRLKNAKDNLHVVERGTMDSVKESTERQMKKIASGKADIDITPSTVGKAVGKGAIIGAAVGVTVSGITNYIKYKNGEITEQEAFREVGEDATKGTISGAIMGGVSLFLPGFPLGTIMGVAIGIYINSVCTNVLDEVFGKGAYAQILHAAGYTAGTARNITEMLKDVQENTKRIAGSNQLAKGHLKSSRCKINEITKIGDKITELLEDM